MSAGRSTRLGHRAALMAHSIELLLDTGSDAAVRAQWRALADVGLPSQVHVKSATNRPHITLVAAQRISPDVDESIRDLASRLPLECVIGAPWCSAAHGSPWPG